MDEATLQRLVDRLDIQDALTTYAAAIDAGDFATLRSVFTEDATALYDKDSGQLRGGDNIVAWVKDATADLDWQHHMISIYGVDIDGDHATAPIYLLSHQTVVGSPHQTRMMTSKYRNKLRRDHDGRWRLSDLDLEVGWFEERDYKQGVKDLARPPQRLRGGEGMSTAEEHNGVGDRKCPVIDFDFTQERPATEYFTELDRIREEAPIAWNNYGGGFWMLNRNALVQEAFQTPEIFSSSATVPTIPEPDYHFIPTMENGAEHRKYRAVLNRSSPRGWWPRSRSRCAPTASSSSSRSRPKARSTSSRASQWSFPRRSFLRSWTSRPSTPTSSSAGSRTSSQDLGNPAGEEAMNAAFASIRDYFTTFMQEWWANPRDPETDFFGRLLESNIGDRPITDEEFLNMAWCSCSAGPDTVKSQLGYMFFHLATHPDDRERIVNEPRSPPMPSRSSSVPSPS